MSKRNMESQVAEQTTENVDVAATPAGIVFPDLPDVTPTRDPSKPSIRQIILQGLAEGRNTPSIAAVIKQFHPNSAAAAKASKHIAWYRADQKKRAKATAPAS